MCANNAKTGQSIIFNIIMTLHLFSFKVVISFQ